MTIFELQRTYYFHDSLLDNIEIDREQSTVTMIIDFCFWAQEDYKESDPETGIIKLSFSGVDYFPKLEGEIGSYSIIKTTCTYDSTWIVSALDDETDVWYSIEIRAKNVEFIYG